jgi:hypothetical protein
MTSKQGVYRIQVLSSWDVTQVDKRGQGAKKEKTLQARMHTNTRNKKHYTNKLTTLPHMCILVEVSLQNFSSRLYGIIPQKTAFFIDVVVRTSNLTEEGVCIALQVQGHLQTVER